MAGRLGATATGRSIDDDGYWFLHGRSDDTIKIAGKRLGPAEVESALVAHPAVAEAAAIGVPDEVKGEAIWCFVVTRPRARALRRPGSRARRRVSEHLGKSFAPSRIVFVADLPKTRSAKIVRRALRAVAAGDDPGTSRAWRILARSTR